MSRQERRALERKARKQARKDLKAGIPESTLIAESTQQSEPEVPTMHSAPATPAGRREPIVLTPEEAALFPRAARLIANYNNAQKSTGPRTPEGKAISSQNNFRHGLRGAFKVLPNEDKSEFDNLLGNLREEHAPSTRTEEILVQQMAEHFWLTRRAKGFQDTMILNPETFTIKMMNIWLRYEAQHQRAFHKCLADLLKLREEKRKAELHSRKMAALLRAEADEAALSQRAEDSRAHGFEWKRRKEELHELKRPVPTGNAKAQESNDSAPAQPAKPSSELLTNQQAA